MNQFLASGGLQPALANSLTVTATKGGLKPALPPDDESPGVPGFRTWRGVYLFVLAAFITLVIALTVFTRVYA